MKKRLVAVAIMLSLILSCFTTVSFGASSTKKMTAYDDVIKSGNNVYCAAQLGIYKVNLKTGYVKQLYDMDELGAAINGGVYGMKLYKGYVYFTEGGPMVNTLNRVKATGGKAKKLANICGGYAIKKDKIYYSGYSFYRNKAYKGVMKLNGKNKKKTKYKARTTNKESNSSGYYINSVYEGETWYEDDYYDTYTEYLVTKDGRSFKLCTYHVLY